MNCPKCGGECWDNRDTKTGKQPDYRCKDKDCKDENGYVTAVWLKDGDQLEPPPMREHAPVQDESPDAERFDISRFKHSIADAVQLAQWSEKNHSLNIPDSEIAKWATTLFINRG